MTKANINKLTLAMIKGMLYEYDVQHVSRSVISDEFYDNKNDSCIKSIGECFSINEGLWHIECCVDEGSIWFYKTLYNNAGRATGYCPKYWLDITELKQYEISGELGYYLMQIALDMRQI